MAKGEAKIVKPATVEPMGEAPIQKISAEQFQQMIINSKRRMSQRKGEMVDMLGDALTQEYSQIIQVTTQIIQQSDKLEEQLAQAVKRIAELEKGSKPQ